MKLLSKTYRGNSGTGQATVRSFATAGARQNVAEP
jgi:hypothetical protein